MSRCKLLSEGYYEGYLEHTYHNLLDTDLMVPPVAKPIKCTY